MLGVERQKAGFEWANLRCHTQDNTPPCDEDPSRVFSEAKGGTHNQTEIILERRRRNVSTDASLGFCTIPIVEKISYIRVFVENLVALGFLYSVSYIKPIPTHEKLFAVGKSGPTTTSNIIFLGLG